MNIIDLFSGAGGLTFGFYYDLVNGQFVRRNNRFIFANEYVFQAAQAFSRNFPDIHMENCDVRSLTEEKIMSLIKDSRLPDGEEVDLIIGGPPCQSFSTVGQRIYNDNAKLYEQYLRILNIVRPKMFLFENVKGMLSMREIFYEKEENGEIKYRILKNLETGKERKRPIIAGYGKKIIQKIKNEFANIENGFGYKISDRILNAVDYGVPENRERVFLIGIRNDINMDFDWEITPEQPLTIEEAISDLPELTEGQSANSYTKPANNAYQRLMRGANTELTQHFCGQYGDKIRTVIANVKQGQAKDDFNALVDSGEIRSDYRLTSGYHNTYGRLVSNQPSTTITNNMCTPSGLRCIHYSQNRALSPREGARIQSFPDWFEFFGTRTDVTKQIGNAVPPLLSIKIANKIKDLMEKL